MSIKVNTGDVVSAADRINNINNDINREFSELESKINSMKSSWNGSGADHATAEFANIKNKFYTPRYNAVNNFVRFMYNQVDKGYNDTESSVVSSADMFR